MLSLDYWLGTKEWSVNTRRRVCVAVVYLVVSVSGITLFYMEGFLKVNMGEGWAQYWWCVLCGLLGLSFRAWQYRKDAVEKREDDARADDSLIPPPFPAYVIDYPIVLIVNGIAVFIISRYFADKAGVSFYLLSFPISFYFGSVMKLLNPKL